MPVDCDGRGCHAECERRHLDREEARRDDSWAWPEAPHLIICAGPERSGSTWLYNAVRLLHRQARVPCDSHWIHTLSRPKIEERLAAARGAHVCVKTHEWEEEYAGLVPDCAKHVILTHRDLRGVVASYRRVGWAHHLPRKYVDDHMNWRTVATGDYKYEDFVRDGQAQLAALASQLGLSLEEKDLAHVHHLLKDMSGQGGRGGVCQITKLWPGHISSLTRSLQDSAGSGDAELNRLGDEAYSASLACEFREYMSLYGYS